MRGCSGLVEREGVGSESLPRLSLSDSAAATEVAAEYYSTTEEPPLKARPPPVAFLSSSPSHLDGC